MGADQTNPPTPDPESNHALVASGWKLGCNPDDLRGPLPPRATRPFLVRSSPRAVRTPTARPAFNSRSN
eukprot:1815229-Karenia_brevis.AAC.1